MSQRVPQKGNRKVFTTEKGVYWAHEKDDVLGRGTYGVVYRAYLETNSEVKRAIKIFSPETMDDAEGIPSTTLREINALKTIVHPNVMTAEEVVIPNGRSPTDMFFVMELCKGTLKDKVAEIIRKTLNSDPSWLNPAKNAKLPASYVSEMKVIAWQLLNSLAVVHSRGVMHRDLKPANILWGYDNLLKLADFGLARFVRGNQSPDNDVVQQTGEVQTMWYRAPEVLLGDEKYGLLVDDWSLGCVIAELFRFRRSGTGRIEQAPLFQGRTDVGTLMIIFETLGAPQPDKIKAHEYLSKLRYWCREYPHWLEGTLRERIPLLDELGFDLLEKLLCLSPSERKASRFLLDHPWFDSVRSKLEKFVPWYRGFEDDYKRMMAVDRLPLPRPIKDAAANKENTNTSQPTGNLATSQFIAPFSQSVRQPLSREQKDRIIRSEDNEKSSHEVTTTSTTVTAPPTSSMLGSAPATAKPNSSVTVDKAIATSGANSRRLVGAAPQSLTSKNSVTTNGSQNTLDRGSKKIQTTQSGALADRGVSKTFSLSQPSSNILRTSSQTSSFAYKSLSQDDAKEVGAAPPYSKVKEERVTKMLGQAKKLPSSTHGLRSQLGTSSNISSVKYEVNSVIDVNYHRAVDTFADLRNRNADVMGDNRTAMLSTASVTGRQKRTVVSRAPVSLLPNLRSNTFSSYSGPLSSAATGATAVPVGSAVWASRSRSPDRARMPLRPRRQVTARGISPRQQRLVVPRAPGGEAVIASGTQESIEHKAELPAKLASKTRNVSASLKDGSKPQR